MPGTGRCCRAARSRASCSSRIGRNALGPRCENTAPMQATRRSDCFRRICTTEIMNRNVQMTVIVDEFGSLEGIATPTDTSWKRLRVSFPTRMKTLLSLRRLPTGLGLSMARSTSAAPRTCSKWTSKTRPTDIRRWPVTSCGSLATCPPRAKRSRRAGWNSRWSFWRDARSTKCGCVH